jgi:hypothetical protein
VQNYVLNIRQLVGVLASPIHELGAHHVQENEKLEQRASTYAVELEPVGEIPDTFVGAKLLPGVFNRPFTDRQVQTAAKETFELWDRKQTSPGRSLLVAVIANPGYGLAAGTIWHVGNMAIPHSTLSWPRLCTMPIFVAFKSFLRWPEVFRCMLVPLSVSENVVKYLGVR